MLTRLTRFSRHFLSQLQQTQGSAVIEPSASSSTPVHLRPYDKSKYEVPMEKIKINSGTFPTTQDTLSSRSSRSLAQRS